MQLQLLQNKNIDKTKWDAAIYNSTNGNIYATSFFLDTICSEYWLGIVAENYEAVMPLPYKIKYGIIVFYQPYFMQQLGVFGDERYMNSVNEFLKIIRDKKYIFIQQFNSYNNIESIDFISYSKIVKRKNHELDLSKTYNEIFQNYNSNRKRNLKKSAEENYTIEEGNSVDESLNFFKNNSKNKIDNFEKLPLEKLKIITKEFLKNRNAVIYNVKKNNAIVSTAIFLIYKNRIYYTLGISAPEDSGASGVLFDYIIKKYSESKYILDFEGSEISGVGIFFKSFGAEEILYTKIEFLKLPFLLKTIYTIFKQ